MPEYFVHVVQSYSDSASRELERLKRIYEDRERLIGLVRDVSEMFLPTGEITGKRLFLKPNWVRHDQKPDHDFWCLRTHDEFVLAALEYFLRLQPASVVIGDAPVQSCKWDLAINAGFTKQIADLSTRYNIPVTVKDYRRVTFDPSRNVVETNRSSLSDYTIFDLGRDSFLEPVSYSAPHPFRVTSYDPSRLAESHGPGYHRYCITNELFKSDLVISMPKIKTHQKAGITAALKNIVGLNGDKDYLPHHRKGGVADGGDCYPGTNFLRRRSEQLLDFANTRKGHFSYFIAVRLAALLWRLSFPTRVHDLNAGWWGNDTTWRMVMDLNNIALYGNADGKIMPEVQRKFYSLCDGIIGGQGNGPLQPDPLNLGVVSFTNHSGMHDVVCALLMRFDYRKINMLRTVFNLSENDGVRFFINNRPCALNDFQQQSIPTVPPPGWVAHLTPQPVGT